MINPHHFHAESIIQIIQGFSYFGIFGFVMFVGYLIPIPEEIALLAIGYIASVGPLKLPLAIAISAAGVIIGDNILFLLSLHGSKYVERLKNKLRKNKLIHYEHVMHEHIGKTIFFIRFIVGLRFFGPVLAGMLKVKWRRFFLINAAASFIHAMFFITLGYFFHRRFLVLVTQVEIIRHVLFFFSATLFGILIAKVVGDKYLKKNKS